MKLHEAIVDVAGVSGYSKQGRSRANERLLSLSQSDFESNEYCFHVGSTV